MPPSLACSRKIIVGEPVMASYFVEDNTKSNKWVQVKGEICGGTLYTNVDYTVVLNGMNTTNHRWIVDVTDAMYNPFPGAQFTTGQLTYSGWIVKNPAVRGNPVLWDAYPYNCTSTSCSHMNKTAFPPVNCTTRSTASIASVIRFTSAGEAKIRLAWGDFPIAAKAGVHVLDQCSYSVKDPIRCSLGPLANTTEVIEYGGNGYCLNGDLECGGLDCSQTIPLSSQGRICDLQKILLSSRKRGQNLKKGLFRLCGTLLTRGDFQRLRRFARDADQSNVLQHGRLQ